MYKYSKTGRGQMFDILSPLKEVRFLDTNVAATPSKDGM